MAPKARGELGEIKTTLATLATTGNAKSEAVVASKRDVFKKIINYMTIGIDMSSLFMQARRLHACCASLLPCKRTSASACAARCASPVSSRIRHCPQAARCDLGR